ncbi:hypothetical protein NP493_273g00007 [Ridgeia piscesae]|uniref:Methyltransferase-like protein 15 n=1 Tax=Ridgeia piscesae TaxID=27915 RepID=A0AAD9NXE4_RIDPI|nr:hypothetical protein NP493_273g00007 [Ridgeia piscesae]
MTFGAGGHTKALLKECPGIRVFGLDRDPLAHNLATQLASQHSQVTPLQGRFSEVHHLLTAHGITASSVDAVLFDLGASSMQFDTPARGFSISGDGPLDMRMDSDRVESQPSAADVVNHLDESGLYKIIKKYGEEKMARSIARAIVDSRYAFGRISTTGQLAKIVSSVFESAHRQDKLMRHSHVATKTFQALRIFVNNEMNELHNGLEIAHHLLRPDTGVCVAISFHSLEDRVVKRHFQGIDMDARCNMSIVDQNRSSAKFYGEDVIQRVMQRRWETVRRMVQPQPEDVEENPRARSAKLRAAVKLC